MRYLAFSILFLALACRAAVAPKPSLAEPSLSPDRSEIAFVSGGDIWSVPAKGGEARLLVSHPATESRPMYSPDGTKLAFTSTRTGNGDIYVVTLATGETKRITYSDSAELLDGWSRDGKWLYFESSGNDIAGSSDVFRVSAEGGTPLEVVRDRFYTEFQGAPSPDGSEIAFVAKGFGRSQWWRHGHAHIDESEIWIKGIADSGAYRQIVSEDAKQASPMWASDGKELFYTSDRSGAENLYRVATDTSGQSRALTHFTDGRLLWPSISYDGKEIVFERNFTIWKVDTKSGPAAAVPIELRGSAAGPAVSHQVLTNFTELALSPDAKKVAVVAHGEVFAASAEDGGDAVRITRTWAPESGVRWSPDSTRLVYISTRNGHAQIFQYDVARNVEEALTPPGAEDDESTVYAPDGKSIAFVRGEKELHVLTLANKSDRKLLNAEMMGPTLTWSPDSRYIAFAAISGKSFRNVNVAAVSDGHCEPVSFLANGETASGIAWSPDGKFLLFDTAQRSEPSQMARVDLTPHVPSFREDQFRDLFKVKENQPEKQNPKTPDKPDSNKEGGAAPAPSTTNTPAKTDSAKIVFEGIRRRLTLMPLGLDVGHPMISPDGKTLVFVATVANQRNLYSYSLEEHPKEPPTPRQLTSTANRKSDYWFSADSKSIFFLDNGHVVSLPLESRTTKAIAVNAPMDVDFDAEKMAAFEQGWGLLNRRFYDPKFHGHDWKAIHDEYAPYVQGSRTPDEMRRVMSLMIGELNASHSGIGTIGQDAPVRVGRLGLRFEREPYETGKGLRIREVIPLGPAALEGSIKPGETLEAVDGQAIDSHTNLDALLEDKVTRRAALKISGRDVVVQPVSLETETGLLYRSWVEANRAYVERISNGKLGYVHIADMSQQSLNQLYIDLDTQNQTKQGVVIDVRDNHGGFVNEYVLDVFTRKNYLTMTPRGGSPAPARPALGQRALGLPTILVTNQGSLSDAEDFTEGYRALKLGKVVGEPTAGWIIYTGGTQLVDGSTLRLPFIRIQDEQGKDMEMHPRPVDVRVERKAGECLAGKDSQLDRAVAVLLGSGAGNEPPTGTPTALNLGTHR